MDVRRLPDLTAAELYEMLKMRVEVFVVEQKCPYPELDGKDVDALHLRLLDKNILLASARILPPSTVEDPVYIGRVVVSPTHRGKRLGVRLMSEAIAACERLFPETPIALGRRVIWLNFMKASISCLLQMNISKMTSRILI